MITAINRNRFTEWQASLAYQPNRNLYKGWEWFHIPKSSYYSHNVDYYNPYYEMKYYFAILFITKDKTRERTIYFEVDSENDKLPVERIRETIDEYFLTGQDVNEYNN